MKTNIFLLIFLVIIGFSNCEKVSIAKPDPLQDAKAIVPEEYLNQLTGLGMVIFGGSNPINMRGIITQESPIVVFDNSDKKKEGEKLVSYLFGITRQTEGDIRLLAGPHVELGHRMSGDGIVKSPDGKNFTIYAKTEGLSPKSWSEYKIIYILSGTIER